MFIVTFQIIGGRMDGFVFTEEGRREFQINRVYKTHAPKGVAFLCMNCEKVSVAA